jgi:hypothetical protein
MRHEKWYKWSMDRKAEKVFLQKALYVLNQTAEGLLKEGDISREQIDKERSEIETAIERLSSPIAASADTPTDKKII